MPDDFDDPPRKKSRYRDSLPAKPPRRDDDDADDDRPPGRPRLIGYYRPNEDECNSAMLCHLLAIFLHFIGPIIIWASKEQESRFIDWHGREALNFSINMAIWVFAAIAILTVVAIVTCGFGGILFPLAFCINIYQIVMNIIALNAAKRGEWYRYPMIFRIIPPPEGMEGLDAAASDDDREYATGDGERVSQPAAKGSMVWVWLLCGAAVLLLGGCCVGGIVYSVHRQAKKVEKSLGEAIEADAAARPQFGPPIKNNGDDFDRPKRDDAAPAPRPGPPPRRNDDRPKPALPADPVERALVQIKSTNRAERLQAIEALGKSGDKRAPKALAEALKELPLRRPASDALKQFGAGAEDDVLPLLNGTDAFTKQAACEVLKEIGTQKSVAALRPLAADRNRSVSRAATDAIDVIKARMP